MKGFTLIELLVVIAILATLAGLTTVLIGTGTEAANRQACVHHVRELVGVLETLDSARYPNHTGPNLLLFLVHHGSIAGKDGLALLFCPGDLNEGLEECGGEKAYENLDLTRHSYGHLTSYAATNERLPKGMMPPRILVADDSADHHNGKGIVVGLTGGAAKWRDRIKDYGLTKKDEIVVGEGSPIEELACLARD